MEDNGIFYPEKGDIVNIFGRTLLVLSEYEWNKDNSAMFAVQMIDGKPDLVTTGVVTFQRKYPKFVDKADNKIVLELSKGIIAILQ